MMKKYYYKKLKKYLSFYIFGNNKVIEVDPSNQLLIGSIKKDSLYRSVNTIASNEKLPIINEYLGESPDYIVLNGSIHRTQDIQILFSDIYKICKPESRLIIIYYSFLWQPLIKLASHLGLREKYQQENWITHSDVESLLLLENFELVKLDQKVIIPIYIPLISNFVNKYISPMPIFKHFNLTNIVIARPKGLIREESPSVSIIIPARNEAGNIEEIVQRIPKMGPEDEIIFIEGGSSDATWRSIQDLVAKNMQKVPRKNILASQQDGKGKGDAVRKGFAMAKNPILMILDADMTVPPENLEKFYKAIKHDKGEFINGSRLVYPMEKKAMPFLNLIGNKFFAIAFSFVLGQEFKDTLCGTKVISKKNYMKLVENRNYFGNFDPFGDFDLIFGAARMGLKIVELPVKYKERIYGETNISRWKHGVILLSMLVFSAKKFKFH